MNKYFKHKKYSNGDIISMIINDLYKKNKYKNILFIRTSTTGMWLDKLLLNNNVTRILYKVDKIDTKFTFHKSTTIIDSNDLENTLNLLNNKYDLICIDSFHEYDISKRDFQVISQFLTETGIIFSHDCYPSNKEMSTPNYRFGDWCGETYIAFTELAYNNPDMYCGILQIDTGIGIISKLQLEFLTNTLDRTKQEQLLLLHKNNNDAYTYFANNSKDIINSYRQII